MEPLVSVIIPVYNVLPYLREALDSVIYQTYKNLEIIIVDDGSADGSGEACDEYKTDPRVRVIHQENRGLSAARNTGLDIMSGDYTMFLDSDDAYHPDTVEKMVAAILKYKADLVICGYNEVETENLLKNEKHVRQHTYQRIRVVSTREALGAALDGRIPTYAWNKIYARKTWDHLRYSEGHVYEDLYIFPHLLERCEKIVVIPQVFIDYRTRRTSITKNRSPQKETDYITARKRLMEKIEKAQPPFSKEKLNFYKISQLHESIIEKASLPGTESYSEIKKILDHEIQQLSNIEIPLSKIKSKSVCYLYRYFPGILLPTRNIFLKIKHIIKPNEIWYL